MPFVVGVPEIAPAALRLKPAGRVPAVILHEYGLTPLVAASVAEYAVPTVPAASEVVVTAGGGTRLMVSVAVLVPSDIDVAVTVAVEAAAMLAGAVYVTAVAV